MKKKQLPKKIWIAAAALLVVLLVGSGVGLAWSRAVPAEQVETYTAYAYTKQSEADYRVHLFPSDTFEEVQEPGKAYLSKLTDYIAADFYFNFQGEQEGAQLSGVYSAAAYLTATTGGEEKRVVWERVFKLLPAQAVRIENDRIVIEESVQIPFAEYRRFAEQIREQTGYSPGELNLLVEFEILLEIQAASVEEMVEKRFDPHLLIPMGGSTFVVGGDLVSKNADGITQERVVPVPGVEQARVVFTLSTFFFAGALAALFFLTSPLDTVTPGRKKTLRLLKKHGDRIATLAGQAPEGVEQAITVNSFDDLLKVADELQKPVFYYPPGAGSGHENLFLVWDEGIIYKYSIDD